jgi:SsrA-binding protein
MSVYAENRKARHDYEILEKYEGGLVLTGAETKAIREGKAKLEGAFVKPLRGELFLVGAHIGPYSKLGKKEDYDPLRGRKLLVHAKEMRHLIEKTQEKGLTIVPFSLYPQGRRIKISFAVCRGRKSYDKRDKLKERDQKRRVSRFIRRGDE